MILRFVDVAWAQGPGGDRLLCRALSTMLEPGSARRVPVDRLAAPLTAVSSSGYLGSVVVEVWSQESVLGVLASPGVDEDWVLRESGHRLSVRAPQCGRSSALPGLRQPVTEIVTSLKGLWSRLPGPAPPEGRASAGSGRVPAVSERVIPMMTVEEVQSRASFEVPDLWLPEGMAVVAGRWEPGPREWVQLVLAHPEEASDPGRPGGGLEIVKGERQGEYVYPPEAIEFVNVSGHPGRYVEGSWTHSRSWDPNADVKALEWSEGVFSYRLSVSGLGLSREAVFRIAESVRSQR